MLIILILIFIFIVVGNYLFIFYFMLFSFVLLNIAYHVYFINMIPSRETEIFVLLNKTQNEITLIERSAFFREWFRFLVLLTCLYPQLNIICVEPPQQANDNAI
jgi:hypothetical protein